ncbi:hypothetical protein B566_EDAN009665 [Ephemera danica]|nr:hypothetical protein B566_EDAN009665 [Ephemera danica]
MCIFVLGDDIGGFNIEGCGKEYYIFETTMSQGDGAYNCTAIGKSILSIETRQELDCVAGLLEDYVWGAMFTTVWTSASNGGCSKNFIWCNGNNDPVNKSFFKFDDEYPIWNEPNNFNLQEHCILFDLTTRELLDAPCFEENVIVCENPLVIL